jgi:hypothetical protein
VTKLDSRKPAFTSPPSELYERFHSRQGLVHASPSSNSTSEKEAFCSDATSHAARTPEQNRYRDFTSGRSWHEAKLVCTLLGRRWGWGTYLYPSPSTTKSPCIRAGNNDTPCPWPVLPGGTGPTVTAPPRCFFRECSTTGLAPLAAGSTPRVPDVQGLSAARPTDTHHRPTPLLIEARANRQGTYEVRTTKKERKSWVVFCGA